MTPALWGLAIAGPRRPSGRWRQLAVAPRGDTELGISFRPRQAEAYGLDPAAALGGLLKYPFQLLRLPAYWCRIETAALQLRFDELDRCVEMAESAGKRLILAIGAIKNFGYPEFFVPGHRLEAPLPEASLVSPTTHRRLLDAAIRFVRATVARYRDHPAVVAWQVEHEPLDPLGMEHSWRLSADFASQEAAAVRDADPSRPILVSGFLTTTRLVNAVHSWRTRGQGDSLAFALRLADIVGVDIYPRHALVRLGPLTLYADGSRRPWESDAGTCLLEVARSSGRRVMVTEGQAEPWEAFVVPSISAGQDSYSCPPDAVLENYNDAIDGFRSAGVALEAYLFWGAEFWLARDRAGDGRYLDVFERILDV